MHFNEPDVCVADLPTPTRDSGERANFFSREICVIFVIGIEMLGIYYLTWRLVSAKPPHVEIVSPLILLCKYYQKIIRKSF